VSLTRTSEGLAGAIEYATDLFDAATVQRLAGQLTALLRGAVEAPGTLLAELPLLTAAERHQVELEWNDTRVADEPECLHEIFEGWAEARPEAPALVLDEESVTYGELNRRATQLAEKLLTLGVEPESRVGIFVETGVHPLVASIAVLKAGGTYVPLDVSYPEERLVFMLDDAGVRVLLTQERLRAALPHHRAEGVQPEARSRKHDFGLSDLARRGAGRPASLRPSGIPARRAQRLSPVSSACATNRVSIDFPSDTRCQHESTADE